MYMFFFLKSDPGGMLFLFYSYGLPEVYQKYTSLSRQKRNTETDADICQNIGMTTFTGPKQKI